MSRLTLTGAGGGGDSFDPRRITGLLYAYNLDETDNGTRYPFDSKGVDLSTVVNAPDNPVGGGIIGQAMQGDGTQYVKSTDASIETTLDGLGNWTWSLWYKRTDTSTNRFVMGNFGYQSPTLEVGGLTGAYAYHRLYFNAVLCYSFYEYNPLTVWDFDDGNWHHFLYTFDGSQANADKIKMYYDGVDMSTLLTVTTAPSATAIVMTRSEMEIGSGVNGSQPTSGSIDLYGFWNWTMTPTDVEYEYNSGSGQAFVAE